MPEQKLNATAASLLGFLHERPMSGWDLYATARERIGNFWSITQSQVYRELSSMAEAGLIEAGERGRRDRQPYRITDSGRAAFHDWVMQEPGREVIRFPLLLTMLFGEQLPPEQLASFLREHRAQHAARLARDEQMYASIPEEAREQYRFPIATMRFGIAYERAALEWFDQLPESILNPSASSHPDTGDSE
jgi:DNA-binding PadR family transcriptional regulator